MSFVDDLATFAKTHRFRGKGLLSAAVTITDMALAEGLPLTRLITDGGGQVRGLGGPATQAVLAKHGIKRVLSKEGGRTSRGTIGNILKYAEFLNTAHAEGAADLKVAEAFWIERVKEFFDGKPFTLRLDHALSLTAAIRDLIGQAESRQKDMPGVMYLGTLMQHLVGAKLTLVLGKGVVQHNSASTNDEAEDRTGDFDIGDVSIHVTTAPAEALVRKCGENISAGRKPLIITGRKGMKLAEGNIDLLGLSDKVDVIEFEQFLTSNVYEHGRFDAAQRRVKLNELVQLYNEIVEEHETDPSLKVEIAKGK